MKYYDFRTILDRYSERNPRDKSQQYDLGKIREKFTEIVDAVGIDSHLLKQHRDGEIGGMVKFGGGKPQFCFPETICDFCAEIILRYTSPDFKKIRSAEFASVDPAVSLFLIDGFTKYLQDLGHGKDTIILQRWEMDRRLHRHSNVLKSKLIRVCRELTDSAEKYEQLLGYEDAVYFLRHMVTREEYLVEIIEQIFYEYESVRFMDCANEAMLFEKNENRIEASKDIFQTIVLADVLEQDEQYQRLLKKLDKLLAEPGFKQGQKGRYNRIISELSCMKKQHEMELFGELVSETVAPKLYLTHPMEALRDAIMSIVENERDRIEREEQEVGQTEEKKEKVKQDLDILKKIYEERGVCFDLPNVDTEDDDLFLKVGLNQTIKGTIEFPCCKAEKMVVYDKSTGYCAVKCPNCGQSSIFNFDKMAARTVSDVRKNLATI